MLKKISSAETKRGFHTTKTGLTLFEKTDLLMPGVKRWWGEWLVHPWVTEYCFKRGETCYLLTPAASVGSLHPPACSPAAPECIRRLWMKKTQNRVVWSAELVHPDVREGVPPSLICGTPSRRRGRRSLHHPPCSCLTVRAAAGQTWLVGEFYLWIFISLDGIKPDLKFAFVLWWLEL